jgi:hypothetical protein
MPAQRNTPPRSLKAKPYSKRQEVTEKNHIVEDDEILPFPKLELRDHRTTRSKYNDVDSDDENPPSLSSDGSDDHDRSSDFDPTLETPTKPGKGSYVFDDEDDDMKPDLSDDEVSYPGIVGDVHQQESEDENDYGKRGKGKGRGKPKAKTTPKKATPSKASGSVGGSGKKPGVGWTPEEDWVLFQMLHPKSFKPAWQDIANSVGRDAKVSYARLTHLTDIVVLFKQVCSHVQEVGGFDQGHVEEVISAERYNHGGRIHQLYILSHSKDTIPCHIMNAILDHQNSSSSQVIFTVELTLVGSLTSYRLKQSCCRDIAHCVGARGARMLSLSKDTVKRSETKGLGMADRPVDRLGAPRADVQSASPALACMLVYASSPLSLPIRNHLSRYHQQGADLVRVGE